MGKEKHLTLTQMAKSLLLIICLGAFLFLYIFKSGAFGKTPNFINSIDVVNIFICTLLFSGFMIIGGLFSELGNKGAEHCNQKITNLKRFNIYYFFFYFHILIALMAIILFFIVPRDFNNYELEQTVIKVIVGVVSYFIIRKHFMIRFIYKHFKIYLGVVNK